MIKKLDIYISKYFIKYFLGLKTLSLSTKTLPLNDNGLSNQVLKIGPP